MPLFLQARGVCKRNVALLDAAGLHSNLEISVLLLVVPLYLVAIRLTVEDGFQGVFNRKGRAVEPVVTPRVQSRLWKWGRKRENCWQCCKYKRFHPLRGLPLLSNNIPRIVTRQSSCSTFFNLDQVGKDKIAFLANLFLPGSYFSFDFWPFWKQS